MCLKCDVQTGHVEGDCFGCMCEEPEKASLQIETEDDKRGQVSMNKRATLFPTS